MPDTPKPACRLHPWTVADNPAASDPAVKAPPDPGGQEARTLADLYPEPNMMLLKLHLKPAPPPPLSVLGDPWEADIEAMSRSKNAPADYPLLALLTATASLLGNARVVRGGGGSNTQPAILWGAAVGTSSSKKSASTESIIDDVMREMQSHVERNFAAEKQRWEADRQAALKAKEPEPPQPVRPLAFIQNSTPAAFVQALSHQPKSLLYIREELSGFFDEVTRPHAEGRDMMLNSYDAKPHVVGRVKFSGEPVSLARLSISLWGTIQPEKMLTAVEAADDGMLSRFLYVWPERVTGYRRGAWFDPEPMARRLYRIADLMPDTREDGKTAPQVICLDEAAEVVYETLYLRYDAQIEKAQGKYQSAVGKASGQALRIALVLEYLWWAGGRSAEEPRVVSAKALECAGMLMDYFLRHAERVYADSAEPQETRNSRLLAQWIMRVQPGEVTPSRVRDSLRLPGLRKRADVLKALRDLTSAGFLEPVEYVDGRPPGRPREVWTVNPRVYVPFH